MNPRARIAALVLVALALVLRASPGAAEERVRTLDTGPFREIEVSGVATVSLVQGDREALTVEAPPGTVGRIRFDNEGGVLRVSVGESGGKLFGLGGGAPRITIAFRALEVLRLSGAIKVDAARVAGTSLTIEATGASQVRVPAIEVKSLDLEGSGAIKAELGGRAPQQRIVLSGAADVRAGDLAGEVATVEVSGAGRAVVNASRTLDVHVSGAGGVEYLGDPKVTQEVSGAARVRRKDKLGAAAFGTAAGA